VYFYAVNIVFKKLHYAWFNWSTHQMQDEKIQTQNLNTGIYKFINAISFNLYYHHNHHTYPNLMNPKRVPAQYLRAKESEVA
jgi:fatty acid desaturase